MKSRLFAIAMVLVLPKCPAQAPQGYLHWTREGHEHRLWVHETHQVGVVFKSSYADVPYMAWCSMDFTRPDWLQIDIRIKEFKQQIDADRYVIRCADKVVTK